MARTLSRRRALLFTVVVFVAFLAGVVEVFYRASIGYIEQQGAELREQSFDPGADLTIVFLGDSFTAGELSESGRPYSDYVPAAFRARGDLRRVQTINLALAGSTTRFHRSQLLRWQAEQDQPADVVMLSTGANNASAQASLQAFLRAPESRGHAPATMRLWYRFPRVVYGLNALAFLSGKYRLEWQDGPRNAGDWNPVDDSPYSYMADGRYCWACPDATSRLMALSDSPYAAWLDQEVRSMVRDVEQAARAEGGRLLTGTYVGETTVMTEPPIDPVRDESEALRLPMLALDDPAVIARFRATTWFTDDGWHLSDEGSRVVAELWVDWFLRLEREGFPPGRISAAEFGVLDRP